MAEKSLTVFPLSQSEITPDLLTRALSELYFNVRVSEVDILTASVHGDGSTSTADRLTLGVKYSENTRNLPSQMLLKTMLAEPHVPLTMYENEVLFYRLIRPEIRIEAPQGFATAFDSASGQFGILMEDLAMRDARFLSATQSFTLPQIVSAVDAMAELRAAHWASPRLASEWSWLPTVVQGGMADVFQKEAWYQHVVASVASSKMKQDCVDRLGRSVAQLWRDVWKFNREVLDREPQTLLHGDLHVANTYVLPNNRVGFLDWQLASRGCWAQDWTYLLVTSLDEPTRRRHQGQLLQYYLDALKRRGVDSAPTLERAWLLYRTSAIWGFAIGWLGCPIENYPPDVMQANLSRLCTALQDLDAFDAM